MKQHEFLVEAFKLVVKSGLFPDATMEQWIIDLLWLHTKGYLFAAFNEEDELKILACAYRMNEVPLTPPEKYPTKSEGKVLFVNWIVSDNNDTNALKKIVSSYFKQHKDIETFCFHDLKQNEKLKVFSKKAKEKKKKVSKKKKIKKKRKKRGKKENKKKSDLP